MIRAMIRMANRIDAKRYPYRWGGGHNASFSGPYDCSGAVSAVLRAAGLVDRPMVSGEYMRWGAPGKGAVTIYANAGHVYMSILGRFFGTTGMNPGGGAGWFPGAPRAGFAVVHVPFSKFKFKGNTKTRVKKLASSRKSSDSKDTVRAVTPLNQAATTPPPNTSGGTAAPSARRPRRPRARGRRARTRCRAPLPRRRRRPTRRRSSRCGRSRLRRLRRGRRRRRPRRCRAHPPPPRRLRPSRGPAVVRRRPTRRPRRRLRRLPSRLRPARRLRQRRRLPSLRPRHAAAQQQPAQPNPPASAAPRAGRWASRWAEPRRRPSRPSPPRARVRARRRTPASRASAIGVRRSPGCRGAAFALLRAA